MGDQIDDEVQSGEELDQGQSVEETEDVDTSSGGETPFGYQAILEKLDEFSQQKIRDDLAEMDQNATKRIESVNASYAPWKPVADAGISPDDVAVAVQIITELNENPAEFYRKLQDHLKSEGKLPTAENIQEAAAAVAGGDDVTETPEDPQISALRAKLEAIDQREQEREASQQRAVVESQIRQELDGHVAQVKQAHPDYSAEDFSQIYGIADVRNRALAANGKQEVFTVLQAADEFEALRQRILSTPRPGRNAPKLTPVGGNAAIDTESRKASDIPAKEFAAEMADLLNSRKE